MSACPGCGLANYEGMCPHCRGDQDAYERELVPPFPSSLPEEAVSVTDIRRVWVTREQRNDLARLVNDYLGHALSDAPLAVVDAYDAAPEAALAAPASVAEADVDYVRRWLIQTGAPENLIGLLARAQSVLAALAERDEKIRQHAETAQRLALDLTPPGWSNRMRCIAHVHVEAILGLLGDAAPTREPYSGHEAFCELGAHHAGPCRTADGFVDAAPTPRHDPAVCALTDGHDGPCARDDDEDEASQPHPEEGAQPNA